MPFPCGAWQSTQVRPPWPEAAVGAGSWHDPHPVSSGAARGPAGQFVPARVHRLERLEEPAAALRQVVDIVSHHIRDPGLPVVTTQAQLGEVVGAQAGEGSAGVRIRGVPLVAVGADRQRTRVIGARIR